MASRTSNSIRNGHFALIYNALNIILGFYSRKVFIDYVGISVLGLNQTAQNLLGFLNLAELGIGSAVAFTLYKPLASNNEKEINEIVTLQGWLYRRVAVIIAAAAVILSFFFPLIFKDIKLPLWYAYASFGVFLYSSLLTYFINYKQIVLSANQQQYSIIINYNGVQLIKTIAQILGMIFLPHPYVVWLILQVVFSTMASLNLNMVIKRRMPYLKCDLGLGRQLVKKYSIITKKIKQTFYSSISGFVLTQTSSLLIFAFVDLKMVAIYGNYMLIANCMYMLMNSVFSGITAGVGNLVAEGDKNKCLDVFNELFSAKFLLIVTLLATFYVSVNPFMSIWIGDELYLDKSTVLIIVASQYIILSRTTVGSYLAVLGMFQDIWAPIAEVVLNIGLSIILGYYWGINGVLMGALISLIILMLGWKPYFLFHYGLKERYSIYFFMYLKHIIAFVITIVLVNAVWNVIDLPTPSNYFGWGYTYLSYGVLFFIILDIALYVLTKGMRDFNKRVVKMLLKSK